MPDPATASTTADAPRGRLERTTWDALATFSSDDPSDALTAFLQSCSMLLTKTEWIDVCTTASAMPAKRTAESVRQFFRANFEPWRVVNADESETGIVTGYYEPLLRGSRTRTAEFKYPLYSAPQDLVTVDLSEVYPDLKFRRLRGRIVGNKLIPYLDRSEIDSSASPLRGLELAYVDNPVELFFLEIQGSGQIQLPDGSRMRVGYADQNGHPFRSVAGQLIRRGEIKAERASMQGIKEWAKRNPRKVTQFLNTNPSFVFFKELSGDLSGPIGTLGVPLTAERSIAVDQRVIPLGVPVYLSTTFPGSKQELNRLMVAQDTGGAIYGAVRADFYWGFGDEAGAQAGRMKQRGKMWVLLPKGYDANAGMAEPRAAAAKTQ
jgi:membrane-bound lytic murein transglycosylase A